MFYDKIQICENHLMDLSNDEFEGCPVCEMQKEINRLKRIIKDLKTPPERIVDEDAACKNAYCKQLGQEIPCPGDCDFRTS